MRGFLWVVLGYCVIRNLVWIPSFTPPQDFGTYYNYALEARAGRNPFIDLNPGFNASAGYVYPLFFMGVLVPFTFLPEQLAARAWWLGNLALLAGGALLAAACLRRVVREPANAAGHGLRFLDAWGGGPLLAACAILCFAPVAEVLRWGQNNLIALGLLAAMAWGLTAGRRKTAGVFLAFAILCKAFPILLLPAVATGLGWAGLATVTLIGLSYLGFLGLSGLWRWEWQLWFVKMPLWTHKGDAPTISIFHTLVNLHGMEPALASRVANGIEDALALCYLAGLIWLWRRRAGTLWMLAWGMVCILPISRFMEFHHLVFLVIPYVILLARAEQSRKMEPALGALVSFLLINGASALYDFQPGLPLEYLYYAGLLVCAIAVLRAAPRFPSKKRHGQIWPCPK